MVKENITVVTGNQNKLREIKGILSDFDLDNHPLDIEEIQSISTEKVISSKAKEAFSHLNKPVIVEDVGFYVDAWQGYPGALIKWAEKFLGTEKLAKQILLENDNRVTVEVCVGYYDGEDFNIFTSTVRGNVTMPKGDEGFGFDNIFIPSGYSKTHAQMTFDEKNSISVRKDVYGKLRDFLKSNS